MLCIRWIFTVHNWSVPAGNRLNETAVFEIVASNHVKSSQKTCIMMTSWNGNIFHVTGLCAGNSPVSVNSLHKGQWRGALMFSLICVWINVWVSNREAGDLRRHRAHYDVIVVCVSNLNTPTWRITAWMGKMPNWRARICYDDFGDCQEALWLIMSLTEFTSTVYWCIASKFKAPRNLYWMSNMFCGWIYFFCLCAIM